MKRIQSVHVFIVKSEGTTEKISAQVCVFFKRDSGCIVKRDFTTSGNRLKKVMQEITSRLVKIDKEGGEL